MDFLTNAVATVGAISASTGTQGCFIWILDEVEMPKQLIEK